MVKGKDGEQGIPEEPRAIKAQPDTAGTSPAQQADVRPGRQRGTDDSFTGRAAQMAVMAELLRLRCNAAIPEVDLGTDVFVFKDDREEVIRLQVKACTAPYTYADGSGFSAKFALPMRQFHRLDDRPPLFYALAVLRDEKWGEFLIVSRSRLQSYFNGKDRFGSYNNKKNDELEITVEFRERVVCSKQDLTDCRNAWKSLPPLQPTPDLVLLPHGQVEATAPAVDAIPPTEESGMA
jgi:hypothetical protein